MPADLTVFPGFSLDRKHWSRAGLEVKIDHISIRDAHDGGIMVYPNLRTADGAVRPGKGRRVVPDIALGGLVHIGQTFAKDWTGFDPAAIVAARIPAHIHKARRSGGAWLARQPLVGNHLLVDIDAPAEIDNVPNFLWQGHFLGQRILDNDDILDVLSFYVSKVMPHVKGLSQVEYDGQFLGGLATIPLDFAKPSTAPFRYLHTFTGIMPGRLEAGTALAAFPGHLPILAKDVRANPAAYEAYVKSLKVAAPMPR